MMVLLACCLFLHAAAAEPSVEILSAYQFPPNVCKILIRNHGEEPLDLREPELKSGAKEGATALWTMAEPDLLTPDGSSWITGLFASALPGEGEIPMRLVTTGKQIPFSLEANPRLVVTYSVQVPEEEKVYIFVLNAAAEDCTITAADINDVPVALAQPVEIPAARNALLCGKCSVRPAPEFEVPQVVIRLTPSGGLPVQVFGRLFRPEHTVLRGAGNTFDTIDCLSHAHGDDTTAATKAIAAATAQRGTLRTIKFCNIDVGDNAAARFAQIMERNHIEPQLAYSDECASGDYVQTLLECVEKVRCATQPGITYAWVFPSDIHAPSSPPYGVARLRT
ncbi:MAG TPA: hypothetical protein VMV39_05685, partial [Terracidiphilus sp.]|nr:hypothetical protein [Terracidiphilus sp.]